jgi:ATP-dependent DNA ligase
VAAQVLARGFEGVVAKDPASPYVGGRTLKWLRVKQPHYPEGERGGSRRVNRSRHDAPRQEQRPASP